MKSAYHYFPFIFISFLLYAVFFYFHEDLLPSNQVKQLTTKKVTALTQPILTATPIIKATSPLKISASTTIIKEQEAPLTNNQQHINQQHINQQRIDQKLQIAPQSKQQAASIIDSRTEQQSASITTEASLLEVIQADYQEAKIRHQNSIKNHLSTDDALLKEFIFNQNMINLPALIPKKITNSKPSKKVKNISSSSDGLNENSVLTSIASTLPINNPAQIIRNNKIKIIAKKPPEQASMSRSEPKKINAKSTDKLTALQEAVAISGKKPKYPQRAALRQQKGQVKATMIVMKNGQTMGVKLTTSSGHEMLDKAVLNFIENERFMPALKGQDKISSEQSYSFSYQ